jgi:ribosomal-protein-alanine N-acetyltransferase
MAGPPPAPAPAELRTERLLLRRWREADRAPFAAMNADPVVMEHFQATLTRAESDAFVERIAACFAERGYGLWALEVLETGDFIGYAGLWPAAFDAPFTPAIEVGWRLAQHAWGHGYAPEAARASVADGFDRLGLAEIVSFTSTTNVNSQRVMQKIGMARDLAGDFDHPNVPAGDRLRRHVLYRL